jgi:dihydrofolate reductase
VPRVRVNAFALSIDGYGAGPEQSLENPIGVGGLRLHDWMFGSRTFQRLHGKQGGATGTDDDFVARSFENLGAWIIGRNMFGPIRGPWPDESWKGWWGEAPPYHVPVFVLTHHSRKPIVMQGGTTFHFLTDGIHSALARAQQAANGKDVRIGGGVATIHQYLRAGLIDELHIAISPVLLGSGERFFADVDLAKLGYGCTERVATQLATHLVLTRRPDYTSEGQRLLIPPSITSSLPTVNAEASEAK